MRILLLSKYSWKGASSRYRTLQFIPLLEKEGLEFTCVPLLNDEYMEHSISRIKKIGYRLKGYVRRIVYLRQQADFDLIWIEKELLPWMPNFIENRLCNVKIPYVIDYDDAIFHLYDIHSNLFIRKLLKNKLSKVIKNSTVCIVGNDYLRLYAQKKSANRIEVIPTVIDLNKYPLVEKENNSITIIGWIGSSSTMKYLEPIKEILEYLCKAYHAEVRVIGEYNREETGSNIKYVKWEEHKEVKLLQECDIGIMPLTDGQWEYGKCGFKLIQYMGCMLPVVASDVGANKTIVDHDYNGYLASSIEDWGYYLDILLSDPELRRTMGKRGREKVEAQYSVQAVSRQIYDVLSEAAGRTK